MVSTAQQLDARPTTGPLALPPLPDRPLVSVLMANYNYARYVGEAIESVLAQTSGNFELIVCDDGSTDDSCDVIERYVRRDPRVKLLRKRNGGMASAWNAALPHSAGQIICLLDADDVFRPGKLEAVVRAFQQRPRAGLLVHAMTVISATGEPIVTVPFMTPFEQGWIADRVIHRGGRWRYMPTSSLAFRRELCPYLFPMDERLFFRHAESLIVTLGPLLTDVAAIEEALSGYRVHGSNRTGGHAHDRKTARRAVDNVGETIEGVNARLAALGMPQRLDAARNLENLQAKFILSLLDRPPRRGLNAEFGVLSRALWRDDLYGRTQKTLGLFVYGAALLLPAGRRPWWLAQTLGYSRAKQHVRNLVRVATRRGPPAGRIGGSVPTELFDVLAQFDASRTCRDWICQKLGHGEQGRAFSIRPRGAGGGAGGGAAALVVKTYDAAKPWARSAARDQHDVLALFHKAVDGATCCGWKVRCPVPLFFCEHPLALVMTEVPGTPLGRLLRDPRVPAGETAESVAGAIAAALHRFWTSSRRTYGEINLDNVLCDPSTRSLSFIDAGIARPARLCVVEKGPWYPASHDLAYLLYAAAAAGVKECALRPGLRKRQLEMVDRILRAACDRLAPGLERGRLLDEVEACTGVHLARIRVSWKPAGIWRHFVRRIAGRYIRQLIDGQHQPMLVTTQDDAPDAGECPMPVPRH